MFFWDNLNFLCEKKGQRPSGLAKVLGFSNATATKWKNGSIPGGDALIKIADYFDCSVDYLLGRTASPSVGSVVLTPAADFSSLEEDHIKKYRQLSQQGKQTVDGLIDNLLLMNGAEPQEKEVQRTVLENA